MINRVAPPWPLFSKFSYTVVQCWHAQSTLTHPNLCLCGFHQHSYVAAMALARASPRWDPTSPPMNVSDPLNADISLAVSDIVMLGWVTQKVMTLLALRCHAPADQHLHLVREMHAVTSSLLTHAQTKPVDLAPPPLPSHPPPLSTHTHTHTHTFIHTHTHTHTHRHRRARCCAPSPTTTPTRTAH
jgi:hypothetical protein